jgi:hypothetical protein
LHCKPFAIRCDGKGFLPPLLSKDDDARALSAEVLSFSVQAS